MTIKEEKKKVEFIVDFEPTRKVFNVCDSLSCVVFDIKEARYLVKIISKQLEALGKEQE